MFDEFCDGTGDRHRQLRTASKAGVRPRRTDNLDFNWWNLTPTRSGGVGGKSLRKLDRTISKRSGGGKSGRSDPSLTDSHHYLRPLHRQTSPAKLTTIIAAVREQSKVQSSWSTDLNHGVKLG